MKTFTFLISFFCFAQCFALCGNKLGYTTQGGTNNPTISGFIISEPVTTNAGNTSVGEYVVYLQTAAGGGIAAVLTDNAGQPGTVLYGPVSQALSTGNNTFVFGAKKLLPSTKYWMAFQSSSDTTATVYDLCSCLRDFLAHTYDGLIPNGATWTASNILHTTQWLSLCFGYLVQSQTGVGR